MKGDPHNNRKRMRLPDFLLIVSRGLRRRCPQCGLGPLFTGWYEPIDKCAVCDLPLTSSDGFTLGLMYVTTAALTGIIIVAMLLIGAPRNLWLGHIAVLVAALSTMFGTMPFRKGLAIGIDYYITLRCDNSDHLKLR